MKISNINMKKTTIDQKDLNLREIEAAKTVIITSIKKLHNLVKETAVEVPKKIIKIIKTQMYHLNPIPKLQIVQVG